MHRCRILLTSGSAGPRFCFALTTGHAHSSFCAYGFALRIQKLPDRHERFLVHEQGFVSRSRPARTCPSRPSAITANMSPPWRPVISATRNGPMTARPNGSPAHNSDRSLTMVISERRTVRVSSASNGAPNDFYLQSAILPITPCHFNRLNGSLYFQSFIHQIPPLTDRRNEENGNYALNIKIT